MNTFYIEEYKNFNLDDVLPLYQDAGWTNYTNNPMMLENAYKNTLKVFAAYEKNSLVGIIRIVGDGFSIIYIQDIIVLQSHQRMGIGGQLLRKVLEQYQQVYQKILLTDNQTKTVEFYKKYGFTSAIDFGCVAFVNFAK